MINLVLIIISILIIPNLIFASIALNEYTTIKSQDEKLLEDNDKKAKLIFNIIILLTSIGMLMYIFFAKYYKCLSN